MHIDAAQCGLSFQILLSWIGPPVVGHHHYSVALLSSLCMHIFVHSIALHVAEISCYFNPSLHCRQRISLFVTMVIAVRWRALCVVILCLLGSGQLGRSLRRTRPNWSWSRLAMLFFLIEHSNPFSSSPPFCAQCCLSWKDTGVPWLCCFSSKQIFSAAIIITGPLNRTNAYTSLFNNSTLLTRVCKAHKSIS